jgi:hypothetical protein
MTTVATCSNDAEAMLLKSLLEANEIPAYVPGELTTQSALDYAGSGIRVCVDEENVEAARRIIDIAPTLLAEGEDSAERTDDKDVPRG